MWLTPFISKGKKLSDLIADERQNGLYKNNPDGDNNSYTESPTKGSHSIVTFLEYINNLKEGTYKLINGQWVKQ